ncbi:MAG TPA: neutral/alkaline non-lysosomal ceramidase N-terminal domain-containing protein [Thermoguttaceae bacterium]|nr:neutral/alkaline non-lysosomal ceramidase N-terminal domain-containing protein [Thermoguttaceae bacterium]
MKSSTSLLTAAVLLALLAAPSGASWAAALEAGVAVADVTPPLNYRMCGYFHERLSTGTHDPLRAKAIVLRQGERQAAMVICDLIGLPREMTVHVRRVAERETGIPAANILLAATHTHTGPLFAGAMRKHLHDLAVAKEGHDPAEKVDYPAQLVEKLVKVIVDAQGALGPVKLEVVTAKQEGLSFNRRFHMKGGGPVRFNPGKMNPNILRPAGPIDPQVPFLLFRTAADNRPLASLAVFALHLDTVTGLEYSADFPYYVEQSLRQELGPDFVSVFANGTCGDINHVDVSHGRPQSGHDEARRIGETLAATLKAKQGDLRPVGGPSLDVRTEVVDVPLQKYSAEEVAWAKEAMKKVHTSEMPFLDRVKAYKIMALELLEGDTLPMTVQVFRFGADVAFVALPGEEFVDLGLAIKKASPFATTMVIELAHDAPGYVPTQKAFAEGSYETVNSRIQPGGGEMLVETAVRLLNDLK